MLKNIDDNSQVVTLWQKCFGDTEQEILFFLNNCRNKKVLAFEEGGKLLSMIILVDCICNGNKSKYIYAACTDSNNRKKGYMTRLLDFSKEKYDNICLIPANYPLIDYYKNRGFIEESKTDYLHFDEIDEVKEYLFEGCSLEEPVVLNYRKA